MFAILTCAEKLAGASLIYHTEPRTKNKNKKLEETKTKPDMLRRNGANRETMQSVLEGLWYREYGGNNFWNRQVLSLEWNSEGVMDGKSGESKDEEEETEETDVGSGVSEVQRLVRGCWREIGSWFQR